ncbi:HesA/MoeB/ThiF family protein [Fundidesulfovibrio soli]|uniref:HesA/MoeB/ThiF family protein n=1 Tax=Fundidesulfovibrio soli TaxID=2922716 RepID=UPI001FAFF1A5|nr:ThiF family adenylyltransferase [Fundidesulfovibrio soli]
MWNALVDRQTGYANFTPELMSAMRGMELAVIGAGGNGAVMEHLVRLGFERFTIIDPDVVEPTNLNRLPFGTDKIGLPKVAAWRDYLLSVNPASKVIPHEMSIDRDLAPWLREVLSGADLVFAGTTDVEANIVVGRICAELGKRMIVGPASSGAWVVSTFTHEGGMTLEAAARLGTEGQRLTEIDYAAAARKFRDLTFYPGREGKYAPGVVEAMFRGDLPARSCKVFVSLTNAAMAFEAVKNTAALRGLPFRGSAVTAMPVFHVFDPYSGCSYYHNAQTGEIGIPDWITGAVRWQRYEAPDDGETRQAAGCRNEAENHEPRGSHE